MVPTRLPSVVFWRQLPASSPAPRPYHSTPLLAAQLTALGVLLGFSYVRSRNLLTPMLIHGAWNGSVLTILFLLASQVRLPAIPSNSNIASFPLTSLLLLYRWIWWCCIWLPN